MTGGQIDSTVLHGADGGVLRAGNFRNRVFNAAVSRCMAAAVGQLPTADDSRFAPYGCEPCDICWCTHHRGAENAGIRLGCNDIGAYAELFEDDPDAVSAVLNKQALVSNVVKMWSKRVSVCSPKVCSPKGIKKPYSP